MTRTRPESAGKSVLRSSIDAAQSESELGRLDPSSAALLFALAFGLDLLLPLALLLAAAGLGAAALLLEAADVSRVQTRAPCVALRRFHSAFVAAKVVNTPSLYFCMSSTMLHIHHIDSLQDP